MVLQSEVSCLTPSCRILSLVACYTRSHFRPATLAHALPVLVVRWLTQLPKKNQGGVRRVQRPAFSNTSPPIPVDEHNSRDLAARVAWMNIFHRVSSGRNGGSGSGRNTSHSSNKNLLSRQHGTGLWNSLSLLVLSFQFF